jgi:uncharacterized protein
MAAEDRQPNRPCDHEVVGAGRPKPIVNSRPLSKRGAVMSQANVGVVKSAYEAFEKGDVPAVLAVMDQGIVWNEAENFPYADRNPYVGPAAVVEGVFARLGGEWEYFKLAIEEIFDAGDTVVSRGRYNAVYKKTGGKISAQFVHFWTLGGGKVLKFQQYTDTLQVAKAIGA